MSVKLCRKSWKVESASCGRDAGESLWEEGKVGGATLVGGRQTGRSNSSLRSIRVAKFQKSCKYRSEKVAEKLGTFNGAWGDRTGSTNSSLQSFQGHKILGINLCKKLPTNYVLFLRVVEWVMGWAEQPFLLRIYLKYDWSPVTGPNFHSSRKRLPFEYFCTHENSTRNTIIACTHLWEKNIFVHFTRSLFAVCRLLRKLEEIIFKFSSCFVLYLWGKRSLVHRQTMSPYILQS